MQQEQTDQQEQTQDNSTFEVNPFEVKGQVNYNRLIEMFGAQPITPEIIERFERVVGVKAHTFLRRGLFLSHRDLDLLLNHVETKGKNNIYLYTGRGPSSVSMHLGHYIPFTFTKWLQDVLEAKLVIQMTNDEKFLFKDLTLEQVQEMTKENIKDIIAIGFDPKRTFIFDNISYIQTLYPNILKVQKHLNINKLQSAFGFTNSDHVGKYMFPAIQMVPAFYTSFPIFLKELKQDALCIIPCAIDQDNYFRLLRDLCSVCNYRKPVLVHSKFLPSLGGSSNGKMSSSTGDALYLNASKKQIDKAVKSSVSGGGSTLELQRLYGADLEKDTAFQYLKIFLDDDDELNHIATEYQSGRMLTGQVKQRCVQVLEPLFKEFQEKRASITEEQYQEFINKN